MALIISSYKPSATKIALPEMPGTIKKVKAMTPAKIRVMIDISEELKLKFPKI